METSDFGSLVTKTSSEAAIYNVLINFSLAIQENRDTKIENV